MSDRNPVATTSRTCLTTWTACPTTDRRTHRRPPRTRRTLTPTARSSRHDPPGRGGPTVPEHDSDPFTRTDVPEAPDDPTDPPVTDGPVNSA